MAKNTKKHKTTKFNLPTAEVGNVENKILFPYNGKAVEKQGFSFSFSCFDRTHELFNLGDNNSEKVMDGHWFVDLLDCLKNTSKMTSNELKCSMYDLHPIDWDNTNTCAPVNCDQIQYWQFRVNKSRGRIIGFLVDGVFYVVWLDPHHNLTNSPGYEKAVNYSPALSAYEILE